MQDDSWEVVKIESSQRQVLHLQICQNGRPLSFAQVIEAWSQEPDFIAWWSGLLASVPFEAYFWELPPIKIDQLSRKFEFALVESPALAKIYADQTAFSQYFRQAKGKPLSTFRDQNGDAILIAPTPLQGKLAYPHLAAFSRRAAVDQQIALWKALSKALRSFLSHQPLWVSASGLKESWLHIRLDQRPTYHSYPEFRMVEGK